MRLDYYVVNNDLETHFMDYIFWEGISMGGVVAGRWSATDSGLHAFDLSSSLTHRDIGLGNRPCSSIALPVPSFN
jgi:hypothetical protein